MKIVDLFSGLGGASQAFVDDEAWGVLRVENNPLLGSVEWTRIMDIFEFRDWLLEQKDRYGPFDVDVVWASPPCTEFSLAFNAPQSIAIREGRLEEYQPYMGYLTVAMEIIEIINPRYWIIENVRGSIKYFHPLVGKPHQILGPYYLWGNFPKIMPDKLPTKLSKDDGPRNMRANRRAVVPYEISQALKHAIENQQSILDF
jgi:hypothetical protein